MEGHAARQIVTNGLLFSGDNGRLRWSDDLSLEKLRDCRQNRKNNALADQTKSEENHNRGMTWHVDKAVKQSWIYFTDAAGIENSVEGNDDRKLNQNGKKTGKRIGSLQADF